MSADKYSLFWCLSESGWSTIAEEDTPDRWVRIYEERVYQGREGDSYLAASH
jgi:hypothetical protein